MSHDGGDTWTAAQVGPAANNGAGQPRRRVHDPHRQPRQRLRVRRRHDLARRHRSFELMSDSDQRRRAAGAGPTVVAGPVTQPGVIRPGAGPSGDRRRRGRAQSTWRPRPSVDIANGAPTGADATNRIVMTYVSGAAGHSRTWSSPSRPTAARSWAAPRAIEAAGDRGLSTPRPRSRRTARDVYVVYNAFTTPFRNDTTAPPFAGRRGACTRTRAAPSRRPARSPSCTAARPATRAARSANALTAEFLGDYVYAAATRTYGAAVWNDARNAADCPADRRLAGPC